MSIRTEVDQLKKQLEEVKTEKPKKWWQLRKRLTRRDIKQSKVRVIFIKSNLDIDFLKARPRDGTIVIDGMPYLATGDFLLSHRGKPTLIIMEGSRVPLNPRKFIELVVKYKLDNLGDRLILHRLKHESIQEKKKLRISGWLIFVLLVGGVIAYAVLSGAFGGG